MKKILKYVLIIVISIIILTLIYAIKPSKKEKENNIAHDKTIQEQVIDVMSINEQDENIIGYITIERIGLEKAPIADGIDNKIINKYIGHFEDSAYIERECMFMFP